MTIDEILPREAASRLADYKRAVEHALPGVEKLILFGSRARGQAREDSDYDIAVVVRDLSDRRRVRRILSGYYAMFHAARAVLFQATGRAPKRHDRTIQQFGLLVRDLDDAPRAAGKAFNEIKDERTAADYDETIVPSSDDARDALRAAVDFLTLCDARYGLRPDLPSR